MMNKQRLVTVDYRPSVFSRIIVAFSGTTGLVVKLVVLSMMNALVGWAIIVLFTQGRGWWALSVVGVLLIFDGIYLVPNRFLPAKFIAPGSFFLIAYLIIPIFFTINTAFQKYSTGHVLSRTESIATNIEQNTIAGDRFFQMTPALDAANQLVLVLIDDTTGDAFIGRADGLEQIDSSTITVDDYGSILPPDQFRLLTPDELASIDTILADFVIPVSEGVTIRSEGLSTALEVRQGLEYDAVTDVLVATDTGAIYSDNGHGSFVDENGEELNVGWRTYVGWENFGTVLRNPLVRAPFVRAFIWTIVFASSTVLISFAIGLFLAKLIDKPKFRFKRIYRSLLVVPYAVPGFLSLLVFRGLLNDDFGLINRLLPFNVPWLFDPFWAKMSVIMVSVWLTTPYFMLVCMGALQAIPIELVEAARVDGAGRWQVFRQVTLPLLLVVVTPLLVASFAFNFNNFNIVYLLTGGGPATDDQSVAGATDILISYTYKLAFESGKGQDYGLASAISIYIFFIVAAISASGFMRSKALENMK
jgi:arabinogalactan oligomer/maltooligosaccharide transport system permease protein